MAFIARGVFMGGLTPAAAASTDTIRFVTITSVGNATGFGDLHQHDLVVQRVHHQLVECGMGGFQPIQDILYNM